MQDRDRRDLISRARRHPKLGVRNAILDGEIGAPDESGVTHGAHQMRLVMYRQPKRLAYFAFVPRSSFFW